MSRNPAKDAVAIIGAGRVPYSRNDGRSGPAMAATASIAAIRDAGLGANDIDGVCGSKIVSDLEMQIALGLPRVTWGATLSVPFGYQMIEAINAVCAGACDTALVYHAMYRPPGAREQADPVRSRVAELGSYGPMMWKARATTPNPEPGQLGRGIGYASWAARYFHDYEATRDDLGLIAINNRSHAVRNKDAIMRSPLTADQYLAAPMIRDPLCLYDLDVLVDGADAFVVTTRERAEDLCDTPVLVHAATSGRTARAREDQIADLNHMGQTIVAKTLWDKSDIALDDVGVFYGYDGYSIINLLWIESVGYCRRGEAAEFLRSSWDAESNTALLLGRVPMNPHGGNLSEGASQGSGIVQDAVRQLRGTAGERQVDRAGVALAAIGGFVWNAAALILHTDS